MRGKASKGISAKGRNQSHQCRYFNQSDQAALPEQFPEGAFNRQAINTDGLALDPPHNDRRRENHAETERFLCEQVAGREHTMGGSNELPEDKSTAESNPRHESRVNQETPARAQSAVVQENPRGKTLGRRRCEGRCRRRRSDVQQSPRGRVLGFCSSRTGSLVHHWRVYHPISQLYRREKTLCGFTFPRRLNLIVPLNKTILAGKS